MRTRVSLFYSAQNLSQSRFTCLGKNKSNLVLILPSLEKKHRGSNGVIKGFRKMKIITCAGVNDIASLLSPDFWKIKHAASYLI